MSQPSAEVRAGIARFQLQMTLDGLLALDRALDLVPDERLGEEAVPGQMPIGILIGHTYQATAMCARAARIGRLNEEDMDGIPDPESTSGRANLEGLAAVARAEIAAAVDAMTSEAADTMIDFYFGFSATGLQSTSIGYSELLHHRGQVMTHLRAMGIEPPDVYAGHG